jgi:hypothetical protein
MMMDYRALEGEARTSDDIRVYSGSRRNLRYLTGKRLASEGPFQGMKQRMALLLSGREIASDAAELVVPCLRLILSSTR